MEVIALVLLIRMIVTRKDTSQTAPRDALRTGLVLLGGGLILAGAFFAVGGAGPEGAMPPFGQPAFAGADQAGDRPVSADYLADAARETGAANAVMAVLLDYRAYDTLGEATVIFVSILGAFVILRRRGRIPAGSGATSTEGRQS